MGERFTLQTCVDCSGGLEYNKENKYWECPYCGKIYERELRFNKVQIDGLAGINDLSRSVLSRLVSLDVNGAERDLSECERINHSSVGTQIARFSLSIVKALLGIDKKNELSKANFYLQSFLKEHQELSDEEEILYDFIDSSDIYALLVIVYGMTNQIERKEFVYSFLDCSQVYNSFVATRLLTILLKDGKIEEADTLLNDFNRIENKYGIMTILNLYPSCEKKIDHIKNLFSLCEDVDLSDILDLYFEKTSDASDVKIEIYLNAISNGFDFSTTSVISSVLSGCNTVETAEHVFSALSQKRLDTETSRIIFEWCVSQCNDLEICKVGLLSLKNSESVLEVAVSDISSLFDENTDIKTREEKLIVIFDNFKISPKNYESILLLQLWCIKGTDEERERLFEIIMSKINSVPFAIVEKYVLEDKGDTEIKACFLKRLLESTRNPVLSSDVFSKYLKRRIDEPIVRNAVIETFVEFGCLPDSDALECYVLNNSEEHSKKALDFFISHSCKTKPDTLDKYIRSLGNMALFKPELAQIMTAGGFTLSVESFVKYLLGATEKENKKIENAKKYSIQCMSALRDKSFTVNVANTSLSGNIAQAYLLTSKDEPYVMQEILKYFYNEKIKLNDPMENLTEGKKIKLHKFIDKNKDSLDKKICLLGDEML